MKKNPVVHFEMPYKNAKRVVKFYATVFGWGMQDAGKNMGNYILAGTAETNKKGMVKTKGTINGGFYPFKSAPTEPSVVIAVNGIKKSMAAIKKAGGKILGKPQDIPGIGVWVSFVDTEGNRVSILRAKRT